MYSFLFFLFFIFVLGCKKAPPAPILSQEHAMLNVSITDSAKQTKFESFLKSGDALNDKKLYPQALEAYEKDCRFIILQSFTTNTEILWQMPNDMRMLSNLIYWQ